VIKELGYATSNLDATDIHFFQLKQNEYSIQRFLMENVCNLHATSTARATLKHNIIFSRPLHFHFSPLLSETSMSV
jgi:hypothetical protein